MKAIGYGFVLGVIFLAFIQIAVAETHDGNLLSEKYERVKCGVELTVGHINAIYSIVPTSDLTDKRSKLEADLTKLEEYATNDDKEGFKNYLKETLKQDFKDANKAVRDWRKENKNNLTKDQKEELKNNYGELKNKYVECNYNALKKFAEAKANAFDAILEGYKNKADKLSEKGVDVTGMNKLLDDAKLEIVDPLKQAISSANDGKSLKDALQKYCLFDSCKEGINFHLAAKFNIEKLEQAIAKIKSRDDYSEVSGKVGEMQGYVDKANNAINSVGTARYSEEQKKEVWDNIRAAYKSLKEIRDVLKEGSDENA